MTDTVVEKITPQSLELSPYHIDNLETLQRFLTDEAVPPPKFDMRSYLNTGDDWVKPEVPRTESDMKVYNECGTSACAVGHGPLAGIPPVEGEWWSEYCTRAFGVTGHAGYGTAEYRAWDFMFGPDWLGNDNTALGAAARIRWFLSGELTTEPVANQQSYNVPKPWLEGLIFEA